MKSIGWTSFRNYRFADHQLSCAGWMIRLEAISVRLFGIMNANLFKAILVILLVTLIGYMLLFQRSGNQPQVSYVYVQVTEGDTLWHIADRHVTPDEDIRMMIYTIRQVNKLNANSEIYPGQVLKVPISHPPVGESRVSDAR